jgi:hypothetical protein
MHKYRILYNGYAPNNAIYREQELGLEIRHDWSRNSEETDKVMFLVHKKLKEHFAKYDILLVEKIK